jgi:hypothetical protein
MKKYRQPGYHDKEANREERRSFEPRPKREGPRSPQMTSFHQVLRCAMCGVALPPSFSDIDFSSQCPKCAADLHSCKNCVFFDPAARFECAQPITERVSPKDKRNMCQCFEARTRVEKQTTMEEERRPLDPREAFERLFRK